MLIDIHLIFNLVDASTSFRSAESWTPICLPKFNDTGFLHAYVSFFPNNSSACLLLLSTDKEQFFELKECKEKIMGVSISNEPTRELYQVFVLCSVCACVFNKYYCVCMSKETMRLKSCTHCGHPL